VSKFAENLDINDKQVDYIDTFHKYVDFFAVFRHIYHKMLFY